jgi:hypothetical protein
MIEREALHTDRLRLEPIGTEHAEDLWRVTEGTFAGGAAGVENRASQRVAEKLGFRREGSLRRGCPLADGGYDGYLYGLLATD